MTTIQVNEPDACMHHACVSRGGFIVCTECGTVISPDYTPYPNVMYYPAPVKAPWHPVPTSRSVRFCHLKYRERSLINHIKHLQQICSRLQLPKQTVDRACIILTTVSQFELPKQLADRPVALMVAAISRATREHRIPRSERQIVQILGQDEHCYRAVLTKAYFAVIQCCGPFPHDPSPLVSTYISQLKLEGSDRAELMSETIRLLTSGNASGRSPSVIVAAAIWAAGVTLKLAIKQSELQVISKRSTMSIRNAAHALWGIRAKEVSK